MELNEVVGQLLSLRENSESFLDESEPDSPWAKDIEAIDTAIEIIEQQKKPLTAGKQSQ